MKKTFAVILALVLMLSASAAWAEETYDQALERVMAAKDKMDAVVIDELPYVIPYDSTTVTLEEINFYQQKFNHSYDLFVILKFSTENLDDDQAYWLQNDMCETLGGLSIYETCDANKLDFKPLTFLCSLRYTMQDHMIYFVYHSSKSTEARKSHSGGEVSFFFYNLTDGIQHYYFKTTIPDGLETPREKIRDKELRNYIYKWIDQ